MFLYFPLVSDITPLILFDVFHTQTIALLTMTILVVSLQPVSPLPFCLHTALSSTHLFFEVLGVEFRASCLLSKYSNTRATLPAFFFFFFFIILEIKSHKLFDGA
jgi:hypothetical protein